MREPLLGVAVGKKGIGKTVTTLEVIKSYVNGTNNVKPRRALILDVNDEYGNIKAISVDKVALFSHHPKIEARRIRPYNPDGSKMTLNDVADTLWEVLNSYKGGLLLIEDINKYIGDYLPNDIIGALCTNRHVTMDIIMHYQSIGRLTTKIWQNLNFLRFHKNSDSVDRHKKKFEDKYEPLKIIEIMVNKQYFNGNKYFYVNFDCDNEKIRGNYTKPMLNDAVEEYIAMNYSKRVKPLLNMKGSNGKSKYTNVSAHKKVKEDILRNYT